MERPQFPGPKKVMTVREVAAYLHVHPSTIYRLVRQNQIPAFRIGSDWRFNIEAIDRWRRQQEKTGQLVGSGCASRGWPGARETLAAIFSLVSTDKIS